MRLNDLDIGEEGIITNVKAKNNIKRRFMDIGLNKGCIIKPVLCNKSMRGYLIKGAIIGIRIEDSKDIEVRK